MSTFVIVCPGCGATNSLIEVITYNRSYRFTAMPSPTNPTRGTYYTQIRTQSNHTISATCESCSWQTNRRPTSREIVKLDTTVSDEPATS